MKTRNRESDPRPVTAEPQRRGSILNSFLAGVATVLALLALGAGGFLLYRSMQGGQVSKASNPQTNTGTTAITPSAETPASPSPSASVEVPKNPYVQFALENKAQVELISVTRVPGKPDEVNVQMRVHRLGKGFVGSETINLGATSARNPITGETYQAVDPVKRSSGPIFLFNMSKEQPVDGYVALKVPQGINTIDILVKNTGAFRNVLISDINSIAGESRLPAPEITATPNPTVTNDIGNSSVSSSPKTPAPQITIVPSTTASNGINNSSVNPSPKTPAPQVAATVTSTPAPTPPVTVEFQSGAFQQLAFGTKAQVELLSAKRVADPQTGNRDVVNVQMRIRRLADKVAANNLIPVGETTARNTVTSETYKAVNPRQNATGTISLSEIRPGASVDAYVWLKVPPNANTLDIFIPETGAIKNVPISN
ncbi:MULTISPECIES: hypothetical protein [Aerosakkonema]|uniref:hypothetical protein n=1 Tax=Aerosakkonema TaxID=1246629 RepID=UPI0035B88909